MADPRQDAQDALQEGARFLDQGLIEEAITLFDRAIKQDGTLVDAYLRRSEAHNFKGESGRAVTDATKALMLDPHNAGAFVDRASAYINMGNYERALADANEAISLAPTAAAHVNRGAAYRGLGKVIMALGDFNKAVSLEPRYPLAFSHRASAFLAMGAHDRAIQDATAAIDLDPRLLQPYIDRGEAYRHKGDLDKAVRDATTVLGVQPNLVIGLVNRAAAYLDQDNATDALADCESVLAQEPENVLAINNRAIALAKLGTRLMRLSTAWSRPRRWHSPRKCGRIWRWLWNALKGPGNNSCQPFRRCRREFRSSTCCKIDLKSEINLAASCDLHFSPFLFSQCWPSWWGVPRGAGVSQRWRPTSRALLRQHHQKAQRLRPWRWSNGGTRTAFSGRRGSWES